MLCGVCEANQAIYAWQPIGKGAPYDMLIPFGKQSKQHPIIGLCEACSKNNYREFTYKGARYWWVVWEGGAHKYGECDDCGKSVAWIGALCDTCRDARVMALVIVSNEQKRKEAAMQSEDLTSVEWAKTPEGYYNLALILESLFPSETTDQIDRRLDRLQWGKNSGSPAIVNAAYKANKERLALARTIAQEKGRGRE